MVIPQLKYNPGVRGDQELIDGFVVRHHHLELILEVLGENTEASNQHLLIVGPRGSGKTTLVRRVAAEVRKEPARGPDWYPIVFAEESYLISSPGEFWLEALFHLGEQTQDERWDHTYRELRKEPDEARLRQRALAQLMDFATESGKRVLLIVENMNMLLGEQMKGAGDWDLRHTLMNEPRVMLLGTATSRFEGIERIDKAWFELFAIHELQPLDTEDCSNLWRAATGEEPRATRLRPIQILTGGNPRLLRILAEFAAGKSFRELMSQLVHLIDEHTEYFKSHLDNLAAQERKVFVSLLELWDPVSSKDVAQTARLGVSKTSSLLSRLVSRGAVQLVDQRGRRKIYQASERLFNIYYLMRRRGHPSNRVRAVVAFMVQFYERSELATIARGIAVEACNLAPSDRADFYSGYQELLEQDPDKSRALGIVDETPDDFFLGREVPDTLRLLFGKTKLPQIIQSLGAGKGLDRFIAVLSDEFWADPIEKAANTIIDDTLALYFLRGTLRNSQQANSNNRGTAISGSTIPVENFATWGLVALLLADQGNWPEALRCLGPVAAKAPEDDAALGYLIEFSMLAAAVGFAKEVLRRVEASTGAPAVEPLLAGLRLFVGEKPRTAQEILEVGTDIAKDIKRLRTALEQAARRLAASGQVTPVST